MFLYSNHKDFLIPNSHNMSTNYRKLSMVFVRHHVHDTQNSEISYYRLVSSCPSLIAHISSIVKKSSLCSLLFMWMTSSSLAHPLNRSNNLLPLWLIAFSSTILVIWHTFLELKPYILPSTSSFLSTSTFVTY